MSKSRRPNRSTLDMFYAASITVPSAWKMKADALFTAAKVLFERWWDEQLVLDAITKGRDSFEIKPGTTEWKTLQHIWLWREATLLLAYASENLLKGLWVAQNFVEGEPMKKFPQAIKTHDQLALARLTSITLNGSEQRLAVLLTGFALWCGKYSTPLSSDDYAKWWGKKITLLQGRYPKKKEFPRVVHTYLAKILRSYPK